jgi:hypothetical protein
VLPLYASLINISSSSHWQNNPSWATAFLRRFWQICPSCFHFFGFRYNQFFLQSKVSFASSVPVLCPLGTGWPSYTPRHRVLFASPPMTRRATVEVFEPTSTSRTHKYSGSQINSESSVLILFFLQNIIRKKCSECGMLQAPCSENVFLNFTYFSVRDIFP